MKSYYRDNKGINKVKILIKHVLHMTADEVQKVTALLIELENQLKTSPLWQRESLKSEYLKNTAQFYCDTLTLTTWLEFLCSNYNHNNNISSRLTSRGCSAQMA